MHRPRQCRQTKQKQEQTAQRQGQPATAKKVVVVLPYRHRSVQLEQLLPKLLRRNVSHVVVAEQGGSEPFNRGGVKNAGFDAAVRDLHLAMGDTVCFHDVDVSPEDKFGDFPVASPGEIWHLYGHEHCLGGVFCVTVGDFLLMGKFAQWGSWGREDSDLMKQAVTARMNVNHSRFVFRFSQQPKPDGFYEVDSHGRRETIENLQRQLKEKIDASRSPAAPTPVLSRAPAFSTSMLVPSSDPRVHHYIFFAPSGGAVLKT